MGDFIGSVPFFIVMGTLFVGLIVLFIVMQKKKKKDD